MQAAADRWMSDQDEEAAAADGARFPAFVRHRMREAFQAGYEAGRPTIGSPKAGKAALLRQYADNLREDRPEWADVAEECAKIVEGR